jgi:hypothetical protein
MFYISVLGENSFLGVGLGLVDIRVLLFLSLMVSLDMVDWFPGDLESCL